MDSEHSTVRVFSVSLSARIRPDERDDTGRVRLLDRERSYFSSGEFRDVNAEFSRAIHVLERLRLLAGVSANMALLRDIGDSSEQPEPPDGFMWKTFAWDTVCIPNHDLLLKAVGDGDGSTEFFEELDRNTKHRVFVGRDVPFSGLVFIHSIELGSINLKAFLITLKEKVDETGRRIHRIYRWSSESGFRDDMSFLLSTVSVVLGLYGVAASRAPEQANSIVYRPTVEINIEAPSTPTLEIFGRELTERADKIEAALSTLFSQPLDVPAEGDDVIVLQRALLDVGEDPGPIDGILGDRTQTALQNYLNRQGHRLGSGEDGQEVARHLALEAMLNRYKLGTSLDCDLDQMEKAFGDGELTS